MSEHGRGSAADAALVVGVGFRPGTAGRDIASAIRDILGDNQITALATIGRRAAESGFQGAANILRVPTVTFTSAELAAVEVPNPAARTFAALATPSIAEAAALLACVRMYGTGRLAITKTVVGNVTIAAAGSRR